jgi:RNA polymerase sigma-70 factor (ECF subfamily)
MNTDETAGAENDESLRQVLGERRLLINLAYRMLGSVSEAEDVTQEAYARWYAMSAQQRAAIASPGAWLTTVASRICLDVLGSARARRERYVGEWIPEPLPDSVDWVNGRSGGGSVDPADRVTLDESITMAFLVVLESLTPAERVAFILHDVFRYPFADVARIVGRTEVACRQLASTARRRVRASESVPTPTSQQQLIVREVKKAWESQDIDGLIALLDPNATAIADGGGIVSAVIDPIVGSAEIARNFVEIARRFGSSFTITERIVNGRPGLVATNDGEVAVVIAFDINADRVSNIWAVRNPQKLTAWMAPTGS